MSFPYFPLYQGKPGSGIFEFRDVLDSVTFSPNCTRRPGDCSLLVSKWSGEQTLKISKVTKMGWFRETKPYSREGQTGAAVGVGE